LAKALSVFVMIVISLSVLSFTLESVPDPSTCEVFNKWVEVESDGQMVEVRSESPVRLCLDPLLERSPYAEIEFFCIMVFSVEFVLRLLSCPADGGYRVGLRNFWFSIMNWIDLIAILPFYIQKGMPAGSGGLQALAVLRVLRLTRVLRIFKMSRNFQGLILLLKTFQKSLTALAMLVFFVAMALILFSTLIFEAEKGTWDEYRMQWVRIDGDQSPFEDIITSMWWCIITMCTVGYGDVWPITFAGQMLAILTIFCGMLIVSLPITIIGANFDEIYTSQAEQNAELKARKKRDAQRTLRNMKEQGVTIKANWFERMLLRMKGDPLADVMHIASTDLSSHPIRRIHKAIVTSHAKVIEEIEKLMIAQEKVLQDEIRRYVARRLAVSPHKGVSSSAGSPGKARKLWGGVAGKAGVGVSPAGGSDTPAAAGSGQAPCPARSLPPIGLSGRLAAAASAVASQPAPESAPDAPVRDPAAASANCAASGVQGGETGGGAGSSEGVKLVVGSPVRMQPD